VAAHYLDSSFNPLWTATDPNYTYDPVRTAQKTYSVSVIQTSQLMLYREIIAVCSQIHTKHKYDGWAERRIAECLTGSTYSDHWALKG